MSEWKRHNIYDENGDFAGFQITKENEKPYLSLFNRMNIGLMKIVFFGGLAVLIPLGILIRLLS